MKLYNKWLIQLSILVMILISIVFLINYVVDPMFCFSHNNIFNEKMYVIDERQQKTNDIYFSDIDYDTLIIGSSRSANINPTSLLPLKAFNYACKSMQFDEYYDYIEFAKKVKGKEFKYLIIGVDFFSTNKSVKSLKMQKMENIKQPSFYINKTEDIFYKIKTLISYDCLTWSIKNIFLNIAGIAPPEVYMLRENKNKLVQNWKKGLSEQKLAWQLNIYNKVTYGSYKYDSSIKSQLQKVVSSNPNSKIIVFTTPVSKSLLKVLKEKNLINHYFSWLKDLTSVFGSFYHFMDINEFTVSHNKHFLDAHHINPKYSAAITGIIIDKPNNKNKFGRIITSENLTEYIKSWNKEQASDL